MKIEILAECVNTLNQLDVDNPEHQKAISVCENYILHSYDLYKKHCMNEGMEYISESEYIKQLCLNESFLGGLAKAALGVGGLVAASKLKNMYSGYSNANGTSGMDTLKGIWNNYGGTGNTMEKLGNLGRTFLQTKSGLSSKQATQQFQRSTVDQKTDAEGNLTDSASLRLGNSDKQIKAAENANKESQKALDKAQKASTKASSIKDSINKDREASDEDKQEATNNARIAENELKKAQSNYDKTQSKMDSMRTTNNLTDNMNTMEAIRKSKQAAKQAEEANKPATASATQSAQTTDGATVAVKESLSFTARDLKEPLTPAIRMPKTNLKKGACINDEETSVS